MVKLQGKVKFDPIHSPAKTIFGFIFVNFAKNVDRRAPFDTILKKMSEISLRGGMAPISVFVFIARRLPPRAHFSSKSPKLSFIRQFNEFMKNFHQNFFPKIYHFGEIPRGEKYFFRENIFFKMYLLRRLSRFFQNSKRRCQKTPSLI